VSRTRPGKAYLNSENSPLYFSWACGILISSVVAVGLLGPLKIDFRHHFWRQILKTAVGLVNLPLTEAQDISQMNGALHNPLYSRVQPLEGSEGANVKFVRGQNVLYL